MEKNKTWLNIGSGPSGLDNWLNVDWGALALLSQVPWLRNFLVKLNFLPKKYLTTWPKIKLFDIRKKLFLKDQGADFIYCSHVLEHFELWEAEKILRECRRVLKKGGIIRIVIPDIGKIIRLYESSRISNTDFCRLWWGFPKDHKPKNWQERISRNFIREHQWHYDQKQMSLLLKKVGFKNIFVKDFRQGETPDIGRLDLPEHQNHSLYLEASF